MMSPRAMPLAGIEVSTPARAAGSWLLLATVIRRVSSGTGWPLSSLVMTAADR
jgi:hypothetical protein